MAGAYQTLTTDDLVLQNEAVTAPMWSNSNPNLSIFYTSSAQAASAASQYYITVYQTASTDTTAEIQFDVAYADQ